MTHVGELSCHKLAAICGHLKYVIAQGIHVALPLMKR